MNLNNYSGFITVLIILGLTVFLSIMVMVLYAVWIRIDETLPLIELKRSYQTRKEALKGAEDFLGSMQTKIVVIPEKARQLKPLAMIRR